MSGPGWFERSRLCVQQPYSHRWYADGRCPATPPIPSRESANLGPALFGAPSVVGATSSRERQPSSTGPSRLHDDSAVPLNVTLDVTSELRPLGLSVERSKTRTFQDPARDARPW